MFKAAINGFGRFGLGLYQAWFEDRHCEYAITHINDPSLTIEKVRSILLNDEIIDCFHKYKIDILGNRLIIIDNRSIVTSVVFTQGKIKDVPWLGVPDIVFECSTLSDNHEFLPNMITKNTSTAIVGSVICEADNILIMGYNHKSYNPDSDKVISFGSCTVIPGMHVISLMKQVCDINQCCINITHSVPKWQLDSGKWPSLRRKDCTLEQVAKKLMPKLGDDVKVNYTYAPYHGVSMMDFSFTLRNPITKPELLAMFEGESSSGSWRRYIAIDSIDEGSETYIRSRLSLTIIKSSLDIRGNCVYFYGYFNNEGSGIRLHELAKYILNIRAKEPV